VTGPTPQSRFLVLIHGFPTASWDWVLLWDDLCRDYTVAALDMIGFGYSDKPVRYAYSILDQADLHDAFFAHLEIRACHLFVHDYGDTVAQELLARYLEQGDSATVDAAVDLFSQWRPVSPNSIAPR
jgi:pimeloyl-ACP methyl ester carboxylesterase